MSTAFHHTKTGQAPQGLEAREHAADSFTVDISNVFEFNREADQVVLQTTQEELIAAFQNAIDDWMFMNEAPHAGSATDIPELIDSALFDESDPEELAMQCL